MFICKDKKSFEDQLETSIQYWKCPAITVSAIGSDNTIYGACSYMFPQEFFQLLNEVAKEVDKCPDQYKICVQFEDLIVESKVTAQQILIGKETNISIGQTICKVIFDEFFVRLCKQYKNRNTWVSTKEVIR